jgi:hypothetical protein
MFENKFNELLPYTPPPGGGDLVLSSKAMLPSSGLGW